MKKILSVVMCLAIVFSAFAIQTNATQSRSYNFSTNYTLTGNPASDIVAIAQAQNGKTQGQLGYTEAWCADFVGDCALLAGQDSAVPTHGAVSSLYSNVINAGGWIVSSPQTGDLAFYKDSYGFCHAGIMVDSLYMISGNMWTSGSSKVETWKYTQYNSGSYASVIFVRPNYKTTTHTHSYNTFAYFLKSHPHYNCYQCSCGDIQPNTSETNYYDLCDTCNDSVEINNGNYFFKHNATGLYMDVRGAVDENNTNIFVYQFNGSTAQWYGLSNSDVTGGGYTLKPGCSSRLVQGYGDTINSGANVCIWENTNGTNQRWKFNKVDGGYTIHNTQNPSCVMDVNNYNSVYLNTMSGSSTQIWSIQNYILYDANGGTGGPTYQMKNYGEEFNLSSAVPTREGYTFLGWSSKADATTIEYSAGGSYPHNINVTLYAVWENNNGQYGDVDGNGAIDATDALLILHKVVGKIKKFPIEE